MNFYQARMREELGDARAYHREMMADLRTGDLPSANLSRQARNASLHMARGYKAEAQRYAKRRLVKINASALANDYGLAYRAEHGHCCHSEDWHRVREAAIDATGETRMALLEQNGSELVLTNFAGDWVFRSPAPGSYRLLS